MDLPPFMMGYHKKLKSLFSVEPRQIEHHRHQRIVRHACHCLHPPFFVVVMHLFATHQIAALDAAPTHESRYASMDTYKCITAAVLLGILIGCTLAPAYQRPNLPVTENLPAAAQTPGKIAVNSHDVIEAELGVRDCFFDPQLQQLIQHALANNRDHYSPK